MRARAAATNAAAGGAPGATVVVVAVVQYLLRMHWVVGGSPLDRPPVMEVLLWSQLRWPI